MTNYPLVMTKIAMERSTILKGKSTISMAIFNSFLYVYQRVKKGSPQMFNVLTLL